MPLLNLGSYHHAALAALHKAGKRLRDPLPTPRLWAARKDILHLIKQFLCDEWLVDSLVDFSGIPEVAVVEGIGEDSSKPISEKISVSRPYAVLRQKRSHILKLVLAHSKQGEELTNNRTYFSVHNNRFCSYIIQVTNGSYARTLSPPYFLAQPPFGVF